jgi:hypothetical protein
MSILPVLGSLGIGLVWGWLAALIPFTLPRLTRQNLKALTALGAGTISLAGIVIAFTGWRLALVFLSGAVIAYIIQYNWRNTLRRKLVT